MGKLFSHKYYKYIGISSFCIFLALAVSSCGTAKKQEPHYSLPPLSRQDDFYLQSMDTTSLARAALDQFIEGSKLQMQGKYAESILEFQEALKYDSNATILFAIGKSYKEINKLPQAQEYIEKALARQKDLIPALELLVEVHMTRYQLDQAVATMEVLAELEPTLSRRFTLARLYEYQSVDKAIKLYEELLSKFPNDLPVMQRLIILYKQNKEEDNYNKLLKKYIKANPDDIEAIYNLVLDQTSSRNYSGAFETITMAYENNSAESLTPVITLLGTGLARDTAEPAKKYISRYLKIVNKDYYEDVPLNVLGGYLAQSEGSDAESELFFNRALAKSDTMKDLPLEIANYCFKNKNYKYINSILEEYYIKYPEDYRYPLTLSYSYSFQGNYEKALDYVRKALELDTLNVDAYIHKGYLHDKMNDYENCFKAYDKALEIEPSNPQVNNNYAYSLAQIEKNLSKAKQMSLMAIQTDTSNASYMDTYAWVNYKLGDNETALLYLQKALALDSTNPEVYEHLGELYLTMNEKDKALKSFLKALELDADNINVKNRIEKLKNK